MGLYSCTCAGCMFHFFQGKTWYYLERWHKKKNGYILKKAQKTDRFDGNKECAPSDKLYLSGQN